MRKEHMINATEVAPSESLIRTMELVGDLNKGDYLSFCQWRDPFPLYENLQQLGFSYITCVGNEIAYEIFIWNAGDSIAKLAVKTQIHMDDLTILLSNIN